MALERIPNGWRVRLRYGANQRGRFRLPDMPEEMARARAERLERIARTLSDAGRHEDAARLLKQAAEAATESASRGVERAAQVLAVEPAMTAPTSPVTFRGVCEMLLSGEIARRHPDRAGTIHPATLVGYRPALERFCQTVGDIPVAKLTLDDAERALAALPSNLAATTRSRYAGLFARIMGLAVFPLRLVERSPLPERWRPAPGPRRVFPFLYPDEDASLLDCLRRRVDAEPSAIDRALLYGFLGREGLRISEACGLTWSDLDLRRGAIRLDKNKTRRPRRWRLGDDVTRALVLRSREVDSSPGARVFRPGFTAMHSAENFRSDLSRCAVTREDLHQSTPERRMIRIHDLRGTFVTLALAAGRSEAWVMDRTGHTTSAMLNRYRSQARHAAELELGWFGPLDELIWPGQARATTSEFPPGIDVPEELLTDSQSIGFVSTRSDLAAAGEPKPVPQSPGPTTAEIPGLDGPVERALALALEAATKAQRWDVVLAVTAELRERRLARTAPGVPSFDAARRKRDGEGGK